MHNLGGKIDFREWKSYLRDVLIYKDITELEKRVKSLESETDYYDKERFQDSVRAGKSHEGYMPMRSSDDKRKQETTSVYNKWRQLLDYFLSIKGQLWADNEYRGKFVAIKDMKIVDVDDDEFQLARRTIARYPEDVILIERVDIGSTVETYFTPFEEE